MTTVEILYFADCPNAQPTVDRVREIAQTVSPDAVLLELLVEVDEVDRLRFLGSPSVRVNGSDVEPGASSRTTFGFTCRRYETREGAVGVPLTEWIRIALMEANGPPPLLARGRTCHCSPNCWCRSGWKRRVRWLWPARHVSS